jgi:hypothetical protein
MLLLLFVPLVWRLPKPLFTPESDSVPAPPDSRDSADDVRLLVCICLLLFGEFGVTVLDPPAVRLVGEKGGFATAAAAAAGGTADTLKATVCAPSPKTCICGRVEARNRRDLGDSMRKTGK